MSKTKSYHDEWLLIGCIGLVLMSVPLVAGALYIFGHLCLAMLVALAATALSMEDCKPDCSHAPEHSFETAELLIDIDTFPTGWGATSISEDRFDYGEEDAASIHFEFSRGNPARYEADLVVLHYGNIGWARHRYEQGTYIAPHFDNAATLSSEVGFSSSGVDQSTVICGYNPYREITECDYYARYQEYIVIFAITIGEGDQPIHRYIGYDEIRELFRALDKRIVDHLALDSQ